MFSRAMLPIALVLALLPALASAEDALQRPGWKLRIWRHGEAATHAVDPTDADSERKLDERLKPLPGSDGLFDATEWWRVANVIVPEGGKAIFDRSSMTLMMFAPNEVVDLADTLLGHGRDDEPCDLELEVSLVEFACLREVPLDGLSYDDVREAAGTTWREREHGMARAQSGQRFVIERIIRKPTLKRHSAPLGDGILMPMAVGDRGLTVELEPVLGPDGSTFDINLAVQHRGPTGANGPVLDARISTSLKIRDDQPALVTTWALAPTKGAPELTHRVALVVRPRVINSGGWPRIPRKP